MHNSRILVKYSLLKGYCFASSLENLWMDLYPYFINCCKVFRDGKAMDNNFSIRYLWLLCSSCDIFCSFYHEIIKLIDFANNCHVNLISQAIKV
ncbi:unnamed protein product [Blepharisma stoltei]|uniref:Uncharacterized protein n=1 Tax=Blepharisma stoltei TaxID=1481888 RepID=A0AAU9JVH5_9CILI|nr:unnamed protein product [Blepharisma stoltei]